MIVIGLGVIFISVMILSDFDTAGIIVLIIGLSIFIIGAVCTVIFNNTEYNHDEYVVKIDNISTKEFIERYEITKRFEYSDVVQVEEIEK